MDDKSSEITAIPKVLAPPELGGYIVTSDAMGTQTEIASQIKAQGSEYLLALKGNQGPHVRSNERHGYGSGISGRPEEGGTV